ncbi:MAG: phospholipase D family protein [Desulfomonilaceae bacterium]
MKRAAFAVVVPLLIFSVIACLPGHAAELTLNNVPAEVFFSPNGGCTDAIVAEIDKAKSSVLLQAYSFTSTPITKALIDAHKRGVKVEAIFDKSQRNRRCTSDLINAGIPTYIDNQRGKAHSKILIIDGATVITGSFNFTKSAENINRENLIILKSRDLARLYAENWKKQKEYSEPYGRDLAPDR